MHLLELKHYQMTREDASDHAMIPVPVESEMMMHDEVIYGGGVICRVAVLWRGMGTAPAVLWIT